MSAPAKIKASLPSVRGRYVPNAPLGAESWFRAGGRADMLFEPADLRDLQSFLSQSPRDIPRTIIGRGSNILVRDGGVRGVVVRLGESFAHREIEGEVMRAGAACACASLARMASEKSLAGFAFLQGIPGSVGGALRMNAGAYESEISDICLSVSALDPEGALRTIPAKEMGFAYRHTAAPQEMIFVEALFQGARSDKKRIAKEMEILKKARKESQPPGARTSGSTFKNPTGGKKAWRLIEEAGCRDLKYGAAHVSPLHCNFLVNTGSASAADIESLGKEIVKRVRDHSGVRLEWEIEIMGDPL